MFQHLVHSEYFTLSIIVTIGIIIGNIKIKGISLDLSAIIFVAIYFGSMGYTTPHIVQRLGLIMFIFAVGLQAGPGLLLSLKNNGAHIFAIGLILLTISALISMSAIAFFGLNTDMVIGVLAGALTSTPGLATATEVTNSPLVSVGYSIGYPFGVIGVILFIKLLPQILKKNIIDAENELVREDELKFPKLVAKHFKVLNHAVIGKKFGDLNLEVLSHTTIPRVQNTENGDVSIPDHEYIFQQSDIVKAIGTNEALDHLQLLLGEETSYEIPMNSSMLDVKQIIVTNKDAIRKSLGELGIIERYNARITRVIRSGIELTPNAHLKLRYGDKITLICNAKFMDKLSFLLGSDRQYPHQDFFILFLGCMLGGLFSLIRIPLPGGQLFGLGLSGGILFSAILLSMIGKTGPIIWNITSSTNRVLKEMGLIFFLVGVGVGAGKHLVTLNFTDTLPYFILGIVITLASMSITSFIMLRFFHFNLLRLIGAISGGMTCTPGLAAAESMTESNAPQIAYATTYPIALLLLICWIKIIAALF